MRQERRDVLVLGANGRLGRAAVEAFAQAGWRVLAQTRRPLTYELPEGAVPLVAGPEDTQGLAAQTSGVQAVVYAINPPYTEWRKHALGALEKALELTEKTGGTFLFPGNVYNYGADMPARLTEETPEAPTTEKGRIRCAMEAELRARAARGLRCRVIRAGDFFGKGVGSWFDLAIVRSLRRGKIVYPGPMNVPHAWAYLPDLARAFVAAAESPGSAAFEAYHFEGYTLTGRELCEALQSVATDLGLRPRDGFRCGGFAWGLFRSGALVLPMWREIVRMAYLWSVPHGLDGSRLRQTFGTAPATPLNVALRQSLLDLHFGER